MEKQSTARRVSQKWLALALAIYLIFAVTSFFSLSSLLRSAVLGLVAWLTAGVTTSIPGGKSLGRTLLFVSLMFTVLAMFAVVEEGLLSGQP